MRRLTILATLLAVLALGLGTAGTASAQGGGLPPSFYGVIPIQLMNFEEFQKMKAGGIGTLRFPVIWREVEPNADDQYDWSRIDYQIYNASLVGAEVMPFFYSTPKWATSGGCSTATKCQSVPPTSSQKTMEAFQDFLKDFADRYGVNGTFWNDPNDQFDPPFTPVRQFQIWNEPSSPTYWNKPNAEQYAQLVKASHDTLTAVDPEARILLAGLFGTPQGDASSKNVMWKYLARFYGAGAADSFDAVALHPYSPDVKGLKFQLNKARKILDKHGDQEKEILITEIGWSSAKPKEDRPLIKGKKGQAKLLTQSYNFLLDKRGKYNIGSIIWYAWADADHDIAGCEFCNTAGLFTLSGKAKKAWTALVKITGGTP